jgi:glucosamine-6-phosphate deaminase
MNMVSKENVMRNESKVAKGWWDYTTLDPKILNEAAKLTEKDLLKLSRPGFTVKFLRYP